LLFISIFNSVPFCVGNDVGNSKVREKQGVRKTA
jgi:hypothetical protein